MILEEGDLDCFNVFVEKKENETIFQMKPVGGGWKKKTKKEEEKKSEAKKSE